MTPKKIRKLALMVSLQMTFSLRSGQGLSDMYLGNVLCIKKENIMMRDNNNALFTILTKHGTIVNKNNEVDEAFYKLMQNFLEKKTLIFSILFYIKK